MEYFLFIVCIILFVIITLIILYIKLYSRQSVDEQTSITKFDAWKYYGKYAKNKMFDDLNESTKLQIIFDAQKYLQEHGCLNSECDVYNFIKRNEEAWHEMQCKQYSKV